MNVKIIRFQKPSSIPGMGTNFMLKSKNPSQHFLGLIWSLQGLSQKGEGINQCGGKYLIFLIIVKKNTGFQIN
jgi:hypothetical protein